MFALPSPKFCSSLSVMNTDALRIVSHLCSRYSGERYLWDEL